MSKFNKNKEKAMPEVSTASLPDIVFMLLFFFMVTTVMREVDLKVELSRPEASEVQKLKNKALVSYVYIGVPMDGEKYGTEPKIQLDDDYAEVNDIGAYIIQRRSEVSESLVNKLITSLKVDKDTKMGVVTDVKQELRKVTALKINYSTNQAAADK